MKRAMWIPAAALLGAALTACSGTSAPTADMWAPTADMSAPTADMSGRAVSPAAATGPAATASTGSLPVEGTASEAGVPGIPDM